ECEERLDETPAQVVTRILLGKPHHNIEFCAFRCTTRSEEAICVGLPKERGTTKLSESTSEGADNGMGSDPRLEKRLETADASRGCIRRKFRCSLGVRKTVAQERP